MISLKTNIKTNKKAKKFVDLFVPILIGVVIALFLRGFVVFNAFVPTPSMEPTIMTGDRLIGSKLSYVFGEPERGDIITFYSPDEPEVTYVKRIIGLPGELVNIVDGKVYINDSEIPLDEPYVNPDDVPKGDFGPYVVPGNCYFVMGDNRNNSLDSRFWKSTNFVARNEISSKIVFRYYAKATSFRS